MERGVSWKPTSVTRTKSLFFVSGRHEDVWMAEANPLLLQLLFQLPSPMGYLLPWNIPTTQNEKPQFSIRNLCWHPIKSENTVPQKLSQCQGPVSTATSSHGLHLDPWVKPCLGFPVPCRLQPPAMRLLFGTESADIWFDPPGKLAQTLVMEELFSRPQMSALLGSDFRTSAQSKGHLGGLVFWSTAVWEPKGKPKGDHLFESGVPSILTHAKGGFSLSLRDVDKSGAEIAI